MTVEAFFEARAIGGQAILRTDSEGEAQLAIVRQGGAYHLQVYNCSAPIACTESIDSILADWPRD